MKSLEYDRSLPAAGLQLALVIGCGLALAWLLNHTSPLMTLVAIFAVTYTIVFLQRPDLGLLFVLAVRSVTDIVSATGPRLADPNVGLFVVLILAGVLFIVSHRTPVLRLPGALPLAFLLLAGTLGILRAPDPLRSIDRWLAVFSALIVYGLVTALFREPKQIQRVVDVVVLSLVVPAIVGLYQYATHRMPYNPQEGVERLYSTFVHPAPLGDYLVILFSVLLCQLLIQTGTRRRLTFVLLVTSAFMLNLTLARAAMVGAVIVYAVVGTLQKRVLLLIGPVVIVFAVLLHPVLAERFANPFGGSFADRQRIWELGFSDWLATTADRESSVATAANRLAGTGPGTVVVLAGLLAHNDYLGVLFEYGAIGLIAFLAMTVSLIFTAYRTWRQTTDPPLKAVALSFLAVACAYPVMSFTDNIFSFTENQLYFWTLAGLTASVARLNGSPQQGPVPALAEGRERVPA